jgi:hypothetical protein
MDLPLTLTMEQQFQLRTYEDLLPNISPDDARSLLLEVVRQLMIKDNVVAHLLKKQLGCL